MFVQVVSPLERTYKTLQIHNTNEQNIKMPVIEKFLGFVNFSFKHLNPFRPDGCYRNDFCSKRCHDSFYPKFMEET